MTPLVAADISGDGGRFNLRMGIIGLAIGVAATVSYTVAGGSPPIWAPRRRSWRWR